MSKRARPPEAAAPRSLPSNGWLPWAALAVALVLAYSPALTGGFVWDDVIIYMLAKKSLLYFWISPYQPDYWPVTYSVLFVLWNLFHGFTLGFHLVNVVVHLANVALLGVTLRQLGVTRGRWLALALFAVHPIQVESVAYIFQIKTLLGATFFLASLALYLKSRSDPKQRTAQYAVALFCAFLALFTKTSTAMLPATLLLAELVLMRVWSANELWALLRTQWRALALRVTPFAVVAAVGVAVTLRFNQSNYVRFKIWDAGMAERLLTAGFNLWFYVWKLVVPWNYSIAYPWIALSVREWTSYVPLLLWAVAAGVAWRLRRVLDGALIVGAAFFVLNLIPALGFTNVFFMKYSLVADHWAYLSTLGLLVPAGLALARLPKAAWPVPWVLVLVLAAVSWHYSQAFKDEETLWQTTLRETPTSDLAHTSVAMLRFGKGNYQEALEHYAKAVEYGPRNEEALYGLGRTMQLLGGDPAKAEQYYRRALELNPKHGKSLNGLGVILSTKKQFEGARGLLERAVEQEPDYYEARNNLALLYSDVGRENDALLQLKTAVQLKPDGADAYVNMGSLYLRMKRPKEAEAALRRALSLNPQQALAHFNLAVLYEELLNDRGRAISSLEEGLRIQPNAQAQRRLDALKAQ